MSSLATFLKSPLARHPALLARKIAERLRLYREKAPIPQPTTSEIVLPPHVKPRIEKWIAAVPITAQLHSFSNVFGHPFDEAELLRLCTNGPVTSKEDLTADIKLIWDFSRAHPVFLNLCVDRNQVDAGAAFLRRWLKANENTNGPAWICAMDVAIRAVNWIAADVLSNGALGHKFGSKDWSEWLWRHGAVIWQRLESKANPSNHYLADLIGLIAIGAIFPYDKAAQQWSRFSEHEFPLALLAQTRADGGLNEASLRYHAFVTEMALVARIFVREPFSPEAEERLQRMCQILADFRDARGDVFPLGDDDSGRVLALDHASPLGRADVLLKLAESLFGQSCSPQSQATCRESGWWVQRAGDWVGVAEFGGVGLHGHGSHAHSDDLSVCIEWRGQSLVIDPGTCAYTWNHAARNRFRSISAHNTLSVDGKDPLPPSRHLFYLPGSDEPWKCETQESSASFERTVAGGIEHRRTIRFRERGSLQIEDEVAGSGTHELTWRFHFAPQWQLAIRGDRFIAINSANERVQIDVGSDGLELKVESSEFSPGYGRLAPCAVAVIRTKAILPSRTRFTFESATTAS